MYIFVSIDCDSTIQIPGAPSPLSDCNMACGGNSSEICGGSSEVLIYTNGEPAPIIVQDVGQWSYEGCFTCVQFASIYIVTDVILFF